MPQMDVAGPEGSAEDFSSIGRGGGWRVREGVEEAERVNEC